MQQKTVSKYTKEQTCEFAKEVIFRHYGSRATQIKYIGGGSFGYVYKAELPVMPYTLTVKACRVAGMQHNESAALKSLPKAHWFIFLRSILPLTQPTKSPWIL